MFFYKEENDIDFGETTIPNIFIDIYMPMGDGLYTKVYLLAYRQVCSSIPDPKFDNNSIARILEVPLSDVINAWKFWEKQNIIKMHKNDSPDFYDYSIEFLDLKRLYVENLQVNTSSIKSNSDRIVSAGENPSITKMFNSINRIIGRFLDPSEKLRILDIREKFNVSPDVIVYAYETAKQSNNGTPKNLNYVEGILRNWYDLGLYTVEDIEKNIVNDKKRYDMYKLIFKSLGFHRNPGTEEKRIMDTWIDKYNMDIEVILEACSKSKNTTNPSISYINGIIEKYKNNNVKTLDDIKKLEEEFNQKKQQQKSTTSNNNTVPKVKTRFHNINETFRNYSPDELERLLIESQKGKF